MTTPSTQAHHPRRGMAIGIVLMLGLIILVLGFAMISNSGSLLRSTVDAKQRVKSRYAAEAMVALQTAAVLEKANLVFGSDLALVDVKLMTVVPGSDEKAEAKFVTLAGSKSKPVQELIPSGDFKGLKGLKIPILIQATGYAPGGAKTEINAEIKMYQIPIFQFGVFYEENLEITPGPDMTVGGPVHTNKNAFFRGYNTGNILSIRGPVTASGTIYQWSRGGTLRYLRNPKDTSEGNYLAVSGLNSTLTPAKLGSLPPASADGIANVSQGASTLKLPIGSAKPIDLIHPRQSSDPPELTRQKFDAKINCASGCLNRFVYHPDSSGPPPWISTPKYFYDRREQTWVRVWDFDVKAMSSQSRDSIFYLLDTVWTTYDGGAKTVLNAFRIVNGDSLPRNLTIASGNPIYIQGNFNVAQSNGPCHPADNPTPATEDKYCNAMIAANSVTLLSGLWRELALDSTGLPKIGSGSLEHTPAAPWFTAKPWLSHAAPASSSLPNDNYPLGTSIRVNAAILAGNKPTPDSVLPPMAGTIDDAAYEANYEGGWHNTIRFLENMNISALWPKDKVDMIFRGSFVCIWRAKFPGLRWEDNKKVMGGGFYTPPSRKWSYDPRFANLNNMPPGTPYLATGVMASWSER